MIRTPRFWQSHHILSDLLLPAAWIYGVVAWLDRRFTQPVRADLPVISIGNVTAGGAGKTPLVLALLPLLKGLGWHPHIISRGYGGGRHTAFRVQPGDNWRSVGDEPLLLAAAAPTWIGAKRIASATAAQQAGADLLLADDAMQHHALHKDISLMVVDGNTGFGNGRMLPAGPLREPLSTALARCDALVLIGDDKHGVAGGISVPVFHARLEAVEDMAWVTKRKFLAFAGIAYPQKFYDSIRALGAELVETEDFPDHHPYQREEIQALLKRAHNVGAQLITTAKDAVRIPPDLRASIHILYVALRFDDEARFSQWLQMKLLQHPS